MRVLIVCSSFPPVNAPGVHRTVALCRRLAEGGHCVTVITMPPAPGQGIDQRLLDRVAPEVEVIRASPLFPFRSCRAALRPGCRHAAAAHSAPQSPRVGSVLRSWLSDWLKVPDSRVGWLVPAVCAGLRAGRRSRPDVIYSTAPMWTANVAGLCLSRLLSRPWVADCRDPWLANPFRTFRHAAHRRVDAWLEGGMMAGAAFVICNTASARDELVSRYPAEAAKLAVIPNGYDATELAEAARSQQHRSGPDGECSFVHAGSFYGARSPFPLMRAMRTLVQRRPDLRSSVRLCQVGPADYDGRSLVSCADSMGIADIFEATGSLPHAEAIRRVNEASVAVVCSHSGAGADLQIPLKFYEYVGLGKPTVVIGGAARAVRRLVGETAPTSIWLVDESPQGEQRLCRIIEAIVEEWRAGRPPPRCRLDVDLSTCRMAERIETVLVQAVKAAGRPADRPTRLTEAKTCSA